MSYDGLIDAVHHRWLVEIRDHRISFRMKHHFLHTSTDFYIPPSYKRAMDRIQGIAFLFWEHSFEYEEIAGYEYYRETKEFIKSLNIPKSLYWIDYLRRFKHTTLHYWQNRLQQRQQPPEELWTWHALFEASKRYL